MNGLGGNVVMTPADLAFSTALRHPGFRFNTGPGFPHPPPLPPPTPPKPGVCLSRRAGDCPTTTPPPAPYYPPPPYPYQYPYPASSSPVAISTITMPVVGTSDPMAPFVTATGPILPDDGVQSPSAAVTPPPVTLRQILPWAVGIGVAYLLFGK